MKFRSYDSLKIFDAVAKKQSMTAAANDLNLSKGSISYQINKLEENLGFALFERNKARLQLTENGRRIWNVSLNALQQIDQEIEDGVLPDPAVPPSPAPPPDPPLEPELAGDELH